MATTTTSSSSSSAPETISRLFRVQFAPTQPTPTPTAPTDNQHHHHHEHEEDWAASNHSPPPPPPPPSKIVCSVDVKRKGPREYVYRSYGYFHRQTLLEINTLTRLTAGSSYELHFTGCEGPYRPVPRYLRFHVPATTDISSITDTDTDTDLPSLDDLYIGTLTMHEKVQFPFFLQGPSSVLLLTFFLAIVIPLLFTVGRVLQTRKSTKHLQLQQQKGEGEGKVGATTSEDADSRTGEKKKDKKKKKKEKKKVKVEEEGEGEDGTDFADITAIPSRIHVCASLPPTNKDPEDEAREEEEKGQQGQQPASCSTPSPSTLAPAGLATPQASAADAAENVTEVVAPLIKLPENEEGWKDLFEKVYSSPSSAGDQEAFMYDQQQPPARGASSHSAGSSSSSSRLRPPSAFLPTSPISPSRADEEAASSTAAGAEWLQDYWQTSQRRVSTESNNSRHKTQKDEEEEEEEEEEEQEEEEERE